MRKVEDLAFKQHLQDKANKVLGQGTSSKGGCHKARHMVDYVAVGVDGDMTVVFRDGTGI